MEIIAFQQHVKAFYAKAKREFVWRYVADPYLVVVSEFMLQQTQTARVVEKYNLFIKVLPTFQALAACSNHQLFQLWHGLGYNRRALYLKQFAQWVVEDHNGKLPADPALLQTQKGLGHATASSICAFAFNMPTVFIETNIRTVFLHHFFSQQAEVTDKQIVPLVQQAVDQTAPRSWYYALMDYGVFLKKQLPNPSRASAHHAKQSKFEGSDRQVRGQIVKFLVEVHRVHKSTLEQQLKQLFPNKTDKKIAGILSKMVAEQLIKMADDSFYL
ncbi:A/G-specific adenine glycosylase [bacterium]|nr:MAG: A/G-specific adenine glycosylase [bacterium]QQR62159.1 MAG: A/G-specific adenine glycosylase [bacterium]QQR63285.1 MAG: A/G-specific adenine glycosylase [bacterium]